MRFDELKQAGPEFHRGNKADAQDRTFVTRSFDGIDIAERHDAALHWGWALFTSGALGCAASCYWVFWWVANFGVGTVPVLLIGFICVPFGLLSCFAFIQVVSGTTCNRLHRIWPSLRLWRHVLILVTFGFVVLFFVLFTIFLNP